MESANQLPLAKLALVRRTSGATVTEFLPDADEIERRPLPRVARLTLYVVFAMLVSFIVWATISEVDRVVVAHGKLLTPLPNLVVQPLETSIVQKLHVRLGQIVKAGELLATLDPTFADADVAQLRTRLRSLDTQAKRLETELSGGHDTAKGLVDADSRLQAQLSTERQDNYQAQLAKTEQTVTRLKAALDTNQRDQQLLAARVKSLREIETMQGRLLQKQFVAPVHFLEAQEKRLAVERDLNLVHNHAEEMKSELAAAESERAAFGKSWRQKTMEELLSTIRERDALQEQLQKADVRKRLVSLTAPVDAVVLEIAKHSQGSIIREAEPLFTLVPLGEDLEAEVQIDALDVGYVKVGDTTRLKLDAFPFQRHGTLAATVRTISEDAFQQQNAAKSAASYYLSRIDLASTRMLAMPKHAKLMPGMSLTAEIVVGKRTVISYLLWPLTKALNESLREP
jgi:hemolysin D